MSEPSVRAASTDDVGAVVALDAEALGDPGRADNLVDHIEAGRCFVAEREGRVVGFVVIARFLHEYEFVSLLVVAADARRTGIGRALMRHAESRCSNDKIFTSTNRSNEAMQRLSESLGYVRSGYIENLDEDDPEIVYMKRLR